MSKLLLEEVMGQWITISPDLPNFEVVFTECPFDRGSTELPIQRCFRLGDLSRLKPSEQLRTAFGFSLIMLSDRLPYIYFRCSQFDAVRVDLSHPRFLPLGLGVQYPLTYQSFDY